MSYNECKGRAIVYVLAMSKGSANIGASAAGSLVGKAYLSTSFDSAEAFKEMETAGIRVKGCDAHFLEPLRRHLGNTKQEKESPALDLRGES